MDGKDERLDPVRSFTVNSLRLDPETWRQFVSEEKHQVKFNNFLSTQDFGNLFLWQDPESGPSVSLDFPKHVRAKVLCVSKAGREVITKENSRNILIIQEVQGEDAISFIISVSEQVTCPLLSNPETSSSWVVGTGEEALSFMERLKNEGLVMKAQTEGRTYLPHPDALQDHDLHDNALHPSSQG